MENKPYLPPPRSHPESPEHNTQLLPRVTDVAMIFPLDLNIGNTQSNRPGLCFSTELTLRIGNPTLHHQESTGPRAGKITALTYTGAKPS